MNIFEKEDFSLWNENIFLPSPIIKGEDKDLVLEDEEYFGKGEKTYDIGHIEDEDLG